MTARRKNTDDDDDAVAALDGALQDAPAGTPMETLMTEAAVLTGALDAAERPAALTVEGTRYVWLPDIEAYAAEEGDLLDLKRPAAVKALYAWRQHREHARAVEAADAERAAAGPDDVHLLHVEHPREFGEWEAGRRWVHVKDLQPGIHGNEGVRLSHGVVVRYAPEEDEDGRALSAERQREHVRLMHFRVTHVSGDGEVVSLEPGERLRQHSVTFYPKPYVYDWLHAVAAFERTTTERWVNKLVHQAYAISDIRTAMAAGAGMAGKRGANAEVTHDLEAGRKARAAG